MTASLRSLMRVGVIDGSVARLFVRFALFIPSQPVTDEATVLMIVMNAINVMFCVQSTSPKTPVLGRTTGRSELQAAGLGCGVAACTVATTADASACGSWVGSPTASATRTSSSGVVATVGCINTAVNRSSDAPDCIATRTTTARIATTMSMAKI